MNSEMAYLHVFVQIISGLDISARPLAQASVKSVGRVQITDHSPVWRVRFFIAKKLIKLQNKRCFLYSVLPSFILQIVQKMGAEAQHWASQNRKQ